MIAHFYGLTSRFGSNDYFDGNEEPINWRRERQVASDLHMALETRYRIRGPRLTYFAQTVASFAGIF